MATKVDKTVIVDVPVETAYNQWTQFEEFPHFMSGISEVRQLDDTTTEWVAEIGGVKRQWRADILEQVPNRKVAWAASDGATNAGAVYFESAGPGKTKVRLELEYEPEGVVETVADKVGAVERRAEKDLDRFKSFIEDEGYATGAWRGTVPGAVGTPGVDTAEASRGDSGKAGVSGKVVAGAAGAAAAAAGLAAAAKAKSGSSSAPEGERATETPVEPLTSTPGTVAAEDEIPADASYPGAPAAPVPASGDPLDRTPVSPDPAAPTPESADEADADNPPT